MEKCISIIVPVYNTEQYLEQCLDSLIGQTYKNLEIIIVNDESPDNSIEIINKYASLDSRIKVISQKNQGLSGARNTGIAAATGDYIIFIDSDDWIDTDACESAIKEIEKTGADVVFWSYIREYPSGGKETSIIGDKRIEWNEDNIKQLYLRMIGLTGKQLSEPQKTDSLVTAWGKLYKMSAVGENRYTDTKIIGTEDALFNIQVFSKIKKAVYLPNFYSHYRKDNMASLTHHYKKNLVKQWRELYRLIDEHLKKNNSDEIFFQALTNRISLGLIGLGINLAEDCDMTKREKKAELKKILSMEHYKNALRSMETKSLPIVWKMFFYCAKRNRVSLVYLLFEAMNYVRGR